MPVNPTILRFGLAAFLVVTAIGVSLFKGKETKADKPDPNRGGTHVTVHNYGRDKEEKAEKEAEKAAKEKAEKEAVEKAAKEKAEKEAAEKAAKEKK